MFTLFFGGRDFAPGLTVDGISIQDYLQEHYINAIKQVAMRLKGLPHVLGYDTLNEPSHGWIGCKDLTRFGGQLRLYESPTVLQSMALGDGIPQNVAYYELWPIGLVRDGASAWLMKPDSAPGGKGKNAFGGRRVCGMWTKRAT